MAMMQLLPFYQNQNEVFQNENKELLEIGNCHNTGAVSGISSRVRNNI